MDRHSLLPVFLKCEGRLCLLVGAGPQGEARLEPLLLAGARVRIVARRMSPGFRERAGRLAPRGEVELHQRSFRPDDLDGVFLAVLATGRVEQSRRIGRLAARRGILVHAVDLPEACDIYAPAVVRRGRLVVAISTSGQAPLLARRLRERIERLLIPAWERYVDWLGEARCRLRENPGRTLAERRADMEELLDGPGMDLLLSGRDEEFRARLGRWYGRLR